MNRVAQSFQQSQTTNSLLKQLAIIPDSWALVAANGNKMPLGNDWQHTPLTKEDFAQATRDGFFAKLVVTKKATGEEFNPPIAWWKAVGVLCGGYSGGLLFIDHDGHSCDQKIEEISGLPLLEALPETVSATSGRSGRYQLIYQVARQYWQKISTQKVSTGEFDDLGKAEQLEFRWSGCQSIILGSHPITGQYHWINSPAICPVAEAPNWIVDFLLENSPRKLEKEGYTSEIERAISYLEAIPPAEDYDTWLKVGQALHSVGESLLYQWDSWSSGAKNYTPGECTKKWKTFGKREGRTIGTLKYLAELNGYQKSTQYPQYPLIVSKVPKKQQSKKALEETDENEILAIELAELTDLNKSAPIKGLLPPKVGEILQTRAEHLNQPFSSFLVVGLPVWGSLLHPGTRLKLDSEYLVPPILFTGLIGESGTLKSAIFETLLNPLIALEEHKSKELEEQYQQELTNWKQDTSPDKGDEPKLQSRTYLLQDFTMEAIASLLESQPDKGITIAVDELAQFFNSMNQYRGGRGRGGDRQKWLSLYGGGYLSVHRKTQKTVKIFKSLLTVTGTIQPDTLKAQMLVDNHSEDGFWQRFMWAIHPLTRIPAPGSSQRIDTFSTLYDIYSSLESLTETTYRLTSEAQERWIEFHNWVEDRVFENFHPSTQSLWRKARDRAARVALICHSMHLAETQEIISEIPLELINSAIDFSAWTVSQTTLIYSDLGISAILEDRDSGRLAALLRKFGADRELSRRDIIRSCNGFRAEDAENLMRRAIQAGIAEGNGKEGRKFKIKFKAQF